MEPYALTSSMKKFKVIILGESFVGKTSLISRFLYDQYDSNYHNTIGIDFFSKSVFIGTESPVRLQLWDSAGQERFRSLIPSYIRNTNAAVLVFDITNSQSFAQIQHWVNEVRSERGNDVQLMLVGNKTDLGETHRSVSLEMAKKKAQEIGAYYMETSAKTGYNVRQLFSTLAAGLASNAVAIVPAPIVPIVPVVPNEKQPAKSFCSCL